jgi:hypothetical protein
MGVQEAAVLFWKKRTKKLLSVGGARQVPRGAFHRQSLFASFSSEKEDLPQRSFFPLSC